MKRSWIFIIVIVLFGTQILFSQDYNIEIKQEEKIDGSFTTTRTIILIKQSGVSELPWLDVQISDRVNSVNNIHETQFWFIYMGNEWRFYDKVVFNIDGKVFSSSLQGRRQTMGGKTVAEVNFTDIFSEEMRLALKNAKIIKYQTSGRSVVDEIKTFTTEEIEAIKKLL